MLFEDYAPSSTPSSNNNNNLSNDTQSEIEEAVEFINNPRIPLRRQVIQLSNRQNKNNKKKRKKGKSRRRRHCSDDDDDNEINNNRGNQQSYHRKRNRRNVHSIFSPSIINEHLSNNENILNQSLEIPNSVIANETNNLQQPQTILQNITNQTITTNQTQWKPVSLLQLSWVYPRQQQQQQQQSLFNVVNNKTDAIVQTDLNINNNNDDVANNNINNNDNDDEKELCFDDNNSFLINNQLLLSSSSTSSSSSIRQLQPPPSPLQLPQPSPSSPPSIEDNNNNNDLRNDEIEYCYFCAYKQRNDGIMPRNIHYEKLENYLRDNYGEIDPYTLGITAKRIYDEELRAYDPELKEWPAHMIIKHIEQHQMSAKVVLTNMARTFHQCLIRIRDDGLFIQQGEKIDVDAIKLQTYIRVSKELKSVLNGMERLEN